MWVVSCTKLVTAVAALQCVERGLFSLENASDVDRLLPEWKDPEILTGWADDGKPILRPATEKITLKSLLTHTSGLGYDFMDPDLVKWRKSRGEHPLAMKKPITECFATPLVFEPGSSWVYGGGVDLAGLMVARANRCALEEYMRKNILDVLDMTDTSMYVGHNDIGKRLMPLTTRAKPEEALMDGCPPEAPLTQLLQPQDEFGGGGLFSTAEDWLKLLKSLLNDDGRLLQSESLDLLCEPSLSESAQTAYNNTIAVPASVPLTAPGQPPTGAAQPKRWSCGLGGAVALEDSDEGFKAGWVRGGGAPNLKWWIDRRGGTCGFFATQLYPPGESRHAFLHPLFHKAMAEQWAPAGK